MAEPDHADVGLDTPAPVDAGTPDRRSPRTYPPYEPSQAPLEDWMCQAKRASDGLPCRKAGINGSGRCRKHGGASPQVIEKHKRQLAERLPKAVKALDRLIESSNEHVQLATVRELHRVNGIGQSADRKAPPPVDSRTVINVGFAIAGPAPTITALPTPAEGDD